MTQTWQEQAVTLAKLEGKATGRKLSWRQIADILDMPKSTVSDFLRRNLKVENFTIPFPKPVGITPKVQQALDFEDNSRILFISDMHAPYHHPDTLNFLKYLKAKYNPTRVVCLGDEIDGHALSFHDSDPDLDSAGPELEKAKQFLDQLEVLFPKMDLIDSNHGSLAYRKAKHHGIPRAMIKSYNEILGKGEGWKWNFDLTLMLPNGQQVYVHHGKNASALKVAQLMGMSHVSGHYHESFGIQYASTPSKLLFGMNCGCLIDRKSLAFAYSNNNLKRQIIGTGLIIDGKPVLEEMPL